MLSRPKRIPTPRRTSSRALSNALCKGGSKGVCDGCLHHSHVQLPFSGEGCFRHLRPLLCISQCLHQTCHPALRGVSTSSGQGGSQRGHLLANPGGGNAVGGAGPTSGSSWARQMGRCKGNG